MRGIPARESPRRGRWTIARGGGRVSARNPWGRVPVFQSPARAEGPWPGGRKRRRRGRTPCKRGLAALSWLSLPGAEAAVGPPPSLRLRPRQWHPFLGADLFTALLQGFRSPLRGSLHPWLWSSAPLRGLPYTGMPRIFAGADTPARRNGDSAVMTKWRNGGPAVMTKWRNGDSAVMTKWRNGDSAVMAKWRNDGSAVMTKWRNDGSADMAKWRNGGSADMAK